MRPLTINPDRPIEELIGPNRGIVRMRLGNMHCMTPFREVARELRPKNIRDASPALRRGLLLCVYETLAEYRGTFLHVVNGR